MDRLRFSEAPWMPDTSGLQISDSKVIIGGAGGIGSWLSLFLNRAGFFVQIWDYDRVESHNTGGQFYSNGQQGALKVDALYENMQLFGDASRFHPIRESVEELELTEDVLFFSAFDNMNARKIFFDRWVSNCEEAPTNIRARGIFIDGRLEMEQLQIFCVPYDNRYIKRYREHLFSDSSVPDLPCSMKQTSHTAAMIASMMTGFFTNHFANLNYGIAVREIPFLHEYVVAGNITKYQLLEDGSDFIPQGEN